MKTIKILGLAAGFMFTVLSLSACGQDKVPATKETVKTDVKNFAVLELFTSEGCSSCPPADEVLARIEKESQGQAIYLLAYHVDYWDRQGWKDVFSNAAYSKRQAQYATWLNTPQIYTPQAIINGNAEFIGSEEPTIRNAISKQLAARPAAALALQSHQNNTVANVHYQASGTLKGSSLLIAVIQKAAQSAVERGENAGRKLSHVQIVRKLQTQALNATGNGNVNVVLPKDFNTQNFEIMGLIQNNSTGEILAAARTVPDNSTYAKK